jgi:hypothetical protein
VSIPPAWHPDPTGRHDHRWWDGTRWTEHVADAGVSAVDPIEQTGRTGADAAGATGPLGEGTTDTPPGHAPAQGGDWTSPGQAGAGGGTWGSPPATEGQGWPAGPTGQGRTHAAGNDGLAIAAGVIGIVSLVLAVFIIGGISGIVAIVLGAVAMSRVKKSGRKGRGMAITGLVTGIVAVVLSILMFGFVMTLFQDYDRCVEVTGDPENCREMTDFFSMADIQVG